MTEPRERDELDDYLEGESALTRAYRDAARAEPPPALDAEIRAAAANAVTTRRSGLERWRVPLAVAAALVVSVTVALLVEREPPPPGAPPAADEYSAPPPRAPEPKASEAEAPQPRDAEAPATAAGEARTKSEAAAPMREQRAPAAQRPEGSAPPPATTAEPAAPSVQQGPPAAAAPAPAPTAPKAVQEGAAPSAPMSAPSGRAEEKAFGDAAAESAKRQRAAPAASGLAKEAPAPEPEAWIERIRALAREGRTVEARDELRRFLRAYPDHPVPDDLAALR
ncbi:MAG TPA: tetratricopeptide repeat protein [Pelomicrobium sp.]|nr:tetratricopeptide repeat protein [Pelomicrobium sp.]